jgi:hypothetical protein
MDHCTAYWHDNDAMVVVETFPRSAGHVCSDLGDEYITLFACFVRNWSVMRSRPAQASAAAAILWYVCAYLPHRTLIDSMICHVNPNLSHTPARPVS